MTFNVKRTMDQSVIIAVQLTMNGRPQYLFLKNINVIRVFLMRKSFTSQNHHRLESSNKVVSAPCLPDFDRRLLSFRNQRDIFPF
jgi:hypothetical protein